MTRATIAVLLLGVAMASAESSSQDDAVGLAKRKLANILKVTTGDVGLVRAEAVDWPDASLGCPEPGMMYAQMITPGHRVTLKVADKTYDVHVGEGRAVTCEGERPSGPVAEDKSSMAGDAARVYQMARKDLAGRLNVQEAAVTVNFVRPTTWPDAGLGCPEPGRKYAPGPVKGFLIEMESGGKSYRYHADATRARLCEASDPDAE